VQRGGIDCVPWRHGAVADAPLHLQTPVLIGEGSARRIQA
jgi:hypothetical protein